MKISATVAGLDERSAGMAFEALREKKPAVPEMSDSGAESVPAAESGTKTVKSEKPAVPAPSEKPSEKPAASTEKPAKRKRTS